MKTTSERKNMYDVINDMIMNKLQNGKTPWKQTWNDFGPARNYVSKKPYVLTPYKTGQESENRFVTVKLGKYAKRKKIIHTRRAIKPSPGSRTRRLHGDMSQV